MTLNATLSPFNSAPAASLSGALAQATPFPIRILIDGSGTIGGGATFRWMPHEVAVDWVQTAVPCSLSPTELGSTGVFVTFTAGSYTAYNLDDNTGHGYQAGVASWTPLHGGAGYILDNSTVVASNSCLYEAHGFNNTRASILFSSGLLGNQSTMASALAGDRTPFHLFYAAQMHRLPTTNQTVALWGWQSQTQAAKDIIDFFATGPSVTTHLDCWGVQRIDTTPTTAQRYNSKQNDGLTRLRPDNGAHIFETKYDGTTLTQKIDGFTVASGAWSGIVNCDRVTFGGMFLDAGPAALFGIHRVSDIALYGAAQNDTAADSVRLRVA